jgi:ribosomal-protein-alanine N-acetyltransferase
VNGGSPHAAWPNRIPELATERLRLRAPAPRDAPALLAILGDPEVTRYHNVPTLTSLAEAQGLLERLERRQAARETIRWAIELVEHGEMIGTVGLLRFDWEHRRAEVGYEIARRSWGRGLAPEAAAAVVGYGFSVLGLHRIEAGVLPGNGASVRVAPEARVPGGGHAAGLSAFQGGLSQLPLVQSPRDRRARVSLTPPGLRGTCLWTASGPVSR